MDTSLKGEDSHKVASDMVVVAYVSCASYQDHFYEEKAFESWEKEVEDMDNSMEVDMEEKVFGLTCNS